MDSGGKLLWGSVGSAVLARLCWRLTRASCLTGLSLLPILMVAGLLTSPRPASAEDGPGSNASDGEATTPAATPVTLERVEVTGTIRHRSAITDGPQAGNSGHGKAVIDQNTPALFLTR